VATAVDAEPRSTISVLESVAGYSMRVPEPVDPGELTTIVAGPAARSTGR
jgi:hypothetical protein